MLPRALGVSSRIVVCWKASSARRSRWPTCQYARRANSADPATAKATSRSSARPRESVRPIGWSGASVSADDDRHLPDGRFLAEPVEIGRQLLLADDQRVTVAPEPLEVVARGRDPDAL